MLVHRRCSKVFPISDSYFAHRIETIRARPQVLADTSGELMTGGYRAEGSGETDSGEGGGGINEAAETGKGGPGGSGGVEGAKKSSSLWTAYKRSMSDRWVQAWLCSSSSLSVACKRLWLHRIRFPQGWRGSSPRDYPLYVENSPPSSRCRCALSSAASAPAAAFPAISLRLSSPPFLLGEPPTVSSRPLLTKSVTAATVSALGEVMGSALRRPPPPASLPLGAGTALVVKGRGGAAAPGLLRRTAAFAFFGLVMNGPVFHWWYGALERASAR